VEKRLIEVKVRKKPGKQQILQVEAMSGRSHLTKEKGDRGVLHKWLK